MNTEKIKEENKLEKKMLNNNTNNNYYSFGNKLSMSNSNKLNTLVQKDYILKLLKNKSNDSKDNQIKIGQNFQKFNILKNTNINLLSKNNEEYFQDKEMKYKMQIQEKNNIINNLMNEIEYYKNEANINNRNKNFLATNLSKKNIFIYSPKNKSINKDIELNLGKDNKNIFRQFHTLDNEHSNKIYKITNMPLKNNIKNNKNNIINILINDDNAKKNDINVYKKYNYNFPEMKKNKLIQKKFNNLTHENYQFDNINISKINNLKIVKLNERNNSNEHRNNIKMNKIFCLINSSCSSSSVSKDNETNNYINNQSIKMNELQNRMNNLFNNLFSIIESNKNHV